MPSNTYQKKPKRDRESTPQEHPSPLNVDTEASQPITSKPKDQEPDQICYHGRHMKHATQAWRRAAIKRQLARGVFELDRIVEYTGIPADEALQIYIELQPENTGK